jgi:hypothetical protein
MKIERRGTKVSFTKRFSIPWFKNIRERNVNISLGPKATLVLVLVLFLGAIYGVSWLIGTLLGFNT